MTTKPMTFDEYKASWEKAFSDAGHEIRLNDEGFKDWFALSYGHHNGPACAKCGWSCCWHCTPASKIPACRPTPAGAEPASQRGEE